MKKLILFTAIMALTINFVSAQTSLILGVSGGVSMAKQKETGAFTLTGEDYTRAFRYGGGIDVGMAFGNFSLLSGARYNTRGGKSETNFSDPNGNYWLINNQLFLGKRKLDLLFNTITVPINLRYAFGGENLQFFVGAGATINILKGNVLQTTDYDLVGNQKAGPFEIEIPYGDLADDTFKKSFSGTQVSLGFLYTLNENGRIKGAFIFDRTGDMVNENLVSIDDQGQIFKPSGSVKSGGINFEIGYEHRINFSVGAKY